MSIESDQIEQGLAQQFLPEIDKLSKIILTTKIKKITPHQNGQIFVKFNNFKATKFTNYSFSEPHCLMNYFFRELSAFIEGYMKNMVINGSEYPHLHVQDKRSIPWRITLALINILKTKLNQEVLDHIQTLTKQLISSFSSPEMSKKLDDGELSKKKFSMKFAKKRISYEIKYAIKLDLNEEDLMTIFKECLVELTIQS